jgi:hypothetical protein
MVDLSEFGAWNIIEPHLCKSGTYFGVTALKIFHDPADKCSIQSVS